jgi:hypothetical protein
MPPTEASRIDTTELARALEAADPAVLLVAARILRRVIKQDRSLSTLGLQVPHPKTYAIDRLTLLQIADPRELEIEPGRTLPETVILIARPEPVKLAQLAAAEALVKFWRRLFHARVHLALEQRLKEGQVTEAGIRQRIQRIGQTEFNEVRNVLLQENYLLPPVDDLSTYVEFAAVYLELRSFGRHLLPHYFPSLARLDEIDALLAEDVDAATLVAATRPAGAPGPQELPAGALQEDEEEPPAPPPPQAEATPLAPAAYERRRRRAERAGGRGNLVRAAIVLTEAAAGRPEVEAAAQGHINQLTRRLQPALELTPAEVAAWRETLPALLPAAAQGFWSVEARLLYDLQKICLDHERGVYTVDAVGWLLSLGRRPLKRPLPAEREVLALKRLRKAARRIQRARLTETDRAQLADLLSAAVARREERLRGQFRPLLTAAFDRVALVPRNLPEEVARDKLIEELLDRIVANGYLNMGDLRDALSRNQLKLDDLAGPGQFVLGDPLIRLNRELAGALDGVYHRGEVYLRWLQRFSAAAFGTRPGRFLTRYLAVPFGGAFIVLSFITYMFEEVGLHVHLTVPAPPVVRDALVGALRGLGVDEYLAGRLELRAERQHKHFPAAEVASRVEHSLRGVAAETWTVVLLGTLVLLLLYVRPFRRAAYQGLRLGWLGIRGVLIDLPAWVLRQPPVRAVLDSRPLVFFRRYLLQPLFLTTLAAGTGRLCGMDATTTAVLSGNVFVIATVFFGSRLGRNFSETLSDWLARSWRRLSLDIIPGLFRLIMQFFKELIELVQRFLYTIDEWLRFRSGEGRIMLALKAAAGSVWFLVTYVVRFAVTLLIEPQINPIKHFPVVTVSHKLLFPVIPVLAHTLAEAMTWDYGYALTIATGIIWCIPGIFGFMAWELRENWFLYRANRPARLRPVMIGHHGETMPRLLRRGFHSGTVPKLHARLRRAERRGRPAAARKALDALHHVGASIRHFIERELVSLLRKTPSWGDLPLVVGEVALASNRIRIELGCPALAAAPLWLVFDEQQGWLLAGLGEEGWLGRLTPPQRRALAAALTGLYKMAAVTLIREQIEAGLPAGCCAYDLTRDRLVVWPDAHYEAEVVYDLRNGPLLPPQPTVGVSSVAMPKLDARRLLFANVVVTWEEWVAAWERDRSGAGLPEPLVPGVQVLPREARRDAALARR